MALIPLDAGDSSFSPDLGQLPSPPRYHTDVELPPENFTVSGLKEGMKKEKARLVPLEEPTDEKRRPVEKETPHKNEPLTREYLDKRLAEITGGLSNTSSGKTAPSSIGATGDFSSFTAPGEVRDFSLGNVARSAGTGAALGGTVGGIPGAAIGALGGGISGAAGEFARSSGTSEATALVAEIATGGLGGVAAKLSKSLSHVFPHYVARRAAFEAEKLGKEFQMPRELMSESEKAVKSRELGVKPEFIGVEQNVVKNQVQKSLATELEGLGIKVAPGQKASDATRDTMYQVMDRMNKNNLPFVHSPQFTQLQKDLLTSRERGLINQSQYNKILSTLKSPLSRNPGVREKSNEDIINLIQGGKQYLPAEGKDVKLIPKDVADQIRARFDDYLKRATGDRISYSGLKQVERLEFQAQAIDSIPTLLRTGFKDIKTKDFETAVKNIKESGPQGKQMFSQAVYQHFFDVSPDKFQSEFNRLSEPLKKTGIMTPSQLDELQRRLHNIPKQIPKERWKRLSMDTLRNSLLDVTSAEIGYRSGGGASGGF